ncbi:kinase-like domain-containing protein [Mycena leptocephala]|nr:kinase-like domain-containing protein [Mycena leptocephala]
MASDSIVSAIINSLECRKILLELSSKLGLADNPALRNALRADEQRIEALLIRIFDSKFAEDYVLCLKGDPAQNFLDAVQAALDRGFLIAQKYSQTAGRIIRKLSESCDTLPSALFITGVTGREQHPIFGGGYGDIYRAKYGDMTVALKHMRHFLRGADSRSLRLKFCREALVWKDLHHPHILSFIGIDRDSFPSSLCMVSPWMEHGTVLQYLKDHGPANVDRLLFEVSQGLQYLHSCNIVHGDLRGTNILVNEDWSACLTDFGLSVFSDASAPMNSPTRAGSILWMAPELIAPDRFGCEFSRTPATDVYAFGCVCVELYTGRPPFSELSEGSALLKVINGERPARPSATPAMSDTLWKHVMEYWAESPQLDLLLKSWCSIWFAQV